MSTKAENTLGKLGLGMAVLGGVVGLFIIFAAGMSNAQDEARRAVFIAPPAPMVAFGLSSAALVVAHHRGILRVCSTVAIWGLVISAGMIVLTIATLRTYE